MKKTLLVACLLAVSLILCACGHDMGQTRGVVDCYSISVRNGGSSVMSETYSVSYTEVHEYKNDKGDSIYTNRRISYYSYDTEAGKEVEKEAEIWVYKNRFSTEHDVYKYSGFIGFISVEYNYYLDLDNNLVDSETKWSELIDDSISTESKEDNKLAYKCAKKNYYVITTNYYYANRYQLTLDMTESSLERHTYTKLGVDSVVNYQAKWF